MKQFLVCICLGAFLISCNDEKNKAATTTTDKPAASADKPAMDLPYTATYSSSWSQDVSDADLKTALMSYKSWTDANFDELSKEMGDTVTVDMNNGVHFVKTNAELMAYWKINRDSLSSVRIEMAGWNKMHSTDKDGSFIVTWYDEYDTYKNGKVDSATYHDINEMKGGKITWYAQYKRPKK